jgi:hypothetical protein
MKMRLSIRTKRPNVWLEILTLGIACACAVALVFVSLGAADGATNSESFAPAVPPAVAASSSTDHEVAPQQRYEGMVTCSHCGAKHSPGIAMNASDCTRICVHGGANFSLIDGDAVYTLQGDLEQVKKVAGQRATIIGALKGKTIQVSSVAASS